MFWAPLCGLSCDYCSATGHMAFIKGAGILWQKLRISAVPADHLCSGRNNLNRFLHCLYTCYVERNGEQFLFQKLSISQLQVFFVCLRDHVYRH